MDVVVNAQACLCIFRLRMEMHSHSFYVLLYHARAMPSLLRTKTFCLRSEAYNSSHFKFTSNETPVGFPIKKLRSFLAAQLFIIILFFY